MTTNELAHYPAVLLADILTRATHDAIESALATAGFGDLTRAHGIVFDMIDPGGSRVVDMAKRARISKQGMGQIVTAVERLGYVERHPDPSDARAQLVILTGRGKQAAAAAISGLNEFENRCAETLGDARFAEFKSALIEVTGTLAAEHIR